MRASPLAERWRTCLPVQETQKTWVHSLSREDPLEKEMEPTPVVLPGGSSWTEEAGRLQSMGSQSWTRLRDWAQWAYVRSSLPVQPSLCSSWSFDLESWCSLVFIWGAVGEDSRGIFQRGSAGHPAGLTLCHTTGGAHLPASSLLTMPDTRQLQGPGSPLGTAVRGRQPLTLLCTGARAHTHTHTHTHTQHGQHRI